MAIFGILLAAGQGSRLKASEPKAFVSVEGETILMRSYRQLAEAGCFEKIIVTVPQEKLGSEQIQRLSDKGAVVVKGGQTRRESVHEALKIISGWKPKPDQSFVIIHDAARCFVNVELIKKTAQEVFKHHAVTTGIPSVDSLKQVDEKGMVVRSLPRSKIWCVQTPQAFRLDLIVKAHAEYRGEATDDASMVEGFFPVKMIEGERSNVKVTTPEDLANFTDC